MVTVLCFTFNTQSHRLLESLNPQVVEEHREQNLSCWRYHGAIPDFWEPLAELIKQEQPTIVAVGFQEDVRPGSYFHSHLLQEQMPKLGYQYYDRQTLMGIGQTSVEGLTQADPFVRGLRLSVYLKYDQQVIQGHWGAQSYSPSLFRNKGAIAIYLTLKGIGVLAIINTHFPFDSNSLIESNIRQDPMIRQNAISEQNRFFNQLYRTLFIDAPAQPRYVILMGDLNYRIDPFQGWSAYETGKLLLETIERSEEEYAGLIDRYDELRRQFHHQQIYSFQEGVDNQGPIFPPTCKLQSARDVNRVQIESFNLGKFNQRVPSHCDRILYRTRDLELLISCLWYRRFDYGTTAQSDHAGVIGLYKLSSK